MPPFTIPTTSAVDELEHLSAAARRARARLARRRRRPGRRPRRRHRRLDRRLRRPRRDRDRHPARRARRPPAGLKPRDRRASRTSIAARHGARSPHPSGPRPVSRSRSPSRPRSLGSTSRSPARRSIITGTVLLVPLVLAVIGARARGRDHRRGRDRGRDRQHVVERHRRHRPEDLPDLFYTAFAALAVVAARARERATELAATNEALAVELRATQARLDGILGSLGEAVTVHDERGKTVYANDAAVDAARLRERRGGAGRRAGRARREVPRSRTRTARRCRSRTCPGGG